MKVEFIWSVVTEAEIPDEEVLAINDSDCSSLDKGDKYAELANKYNVLPIEDGEIAAVFKLGSTDIGPIWEN